MTLTCTLQNGSKTPVVISINPPLRGYEDVKPRLLEMKALAQEGLGMVSTTSLIHVYTPYAPADKIPKDNIPHAPRKRARQLASNPLLRLPLPQPSSFPLRIRISSDAHQLSPIPPPSIHHLIHVLDSANPPLPRISVHTLPMPYPLRRNRTRGKLRFKHFI
jgi:hypothetical protein